MKLFEHIKDIYSKIFCMYAEHDYRHIAGIIIGSLLTLLGLHTGVQLMLALTICYMISWSFASEYVSRIQCQSAKQCAQHHFEFDLAFLLLTTIGACIFDIVQFYNIICCDTALCILACMAFIDFHQNHK